MWQVEIDRFCCGVLARHWPGVTRYSDVRTVGAHNLARVDVITGGFPCQDISPAGRRAGIAGQQSGLWREFLRVVREIRPRVIVVENSAALLHPGRGMGTVLGELAEIRYDAEWDCIPASAVRAPHIRDRVWIVAYPRREHGALQQESRSSLAASIQPTRASVKGPVSNPLEVGRHEADQAVLSRQSNTPRSVAVADADKDGWFGSRLPVSDGAGRHAHEGVDALWCGPSLANAPAPRPPLVFGREARSDFARWRASDRCRWWDAEPKVVRVVHGVSAKVVRRRDQHSKQVGALGNAVLPQITEWLARRVKAALEATA